MFCLRRLAAPVPRQERLFTRDRHPCRSLVLCGDGFPSKKSVEDSVCAFGGHDTSLFLLSPTGNFLSIAKESHQRTPAETIGFWRHFFILFAAVGKKYAVGDKKDDGPPVAKRKSPLLRAKEQKAVEPSHRTAPQPKKQNEKSSVRLHRAFNHQIARVTLPERRHRVQTYTWRGVPLITAFTRLTLGFQGRLERR